MAEAVSIVTVNQNYSIQLHEENLKKILLENEKLRNCKIVPIAITGAMRTGKSFMLNYFLRYLRAQYVSHDISNWLGEKEEPLSGFESHASVNRVTAGIMMWPEVFLYDSLEHGPLTIVLMDTQGLFDNQTTVKDNSAIFALSTMMASMQIYNVMCNLNENDLQLMQLFSEYGKAAMENTTSKPFQKLMILVRDWNPQNGLEFGFQGGRDLVEKRMRGDPRLKSVRDDIFASFDSVEGFLMRHPGDRLYENDFDGSTAFLHNEFTRTLKEFIESVLSPANLIPKRLNGETIDLVAYVNNFRFYAEYFSKNELPAPENFTTAMAHNNALNALKAAVEQYQEIMSTQRFGSLDQLDHVHQEVHEIVMHRFDLATKFGRKHAESYRGQLDQLIGKIRKELQKETLQIFDEQEEPIRTLEMREGVLSRLVSFFKVVFCAIEELFSKIARILRPVIDELEVHTTNVAVEVAKVLVSELGKKVAVEAVEMIKQTAVPRILA